LVSDTPAGDGKNNKILQCIPWNTCVRCVHQPVRLGGVHQPVKLDKMVDGEKDADHIHGDPQEVQDVMPAQYTPHSHFVTSFRN
jgi:hypothetical protein